MDLHAECKELLSLTNANWKVDKHIIASLKTKNTRTTGLRKLFISVENLKKRLNLVCLHPVACVRSGNGVFSVYS
jgi:hypothetical protein